MSVGYKNKLFNRLNFVQKVHYTKFKALKKEKKTPFSPSSTSGHPEVDRLNSELISLKKCIDDYRLRLQKSKLLNQNIYQEIKALLPKPTSEPVIYEERLFVEIQKKISKLNETQKASNHLILVYDDLIKSFSKRDKKAVTSTTTAVMTTKLPLLSKNAPRTSQITRMYYTLPSIGKGRGRPVRSLSTAARIAQSNSRQYYEFPQISGKHLNSESEAKMLAGSSKRLKNVIAIQKIIYKFFDTLDADFIDERFSKMRTSNEAMENADNFMKSEIEALSQKHDIISTLVEDAISDSKGADRMVSEGASMYETQKTRLDEKRKELKELLMQNRAIEKSLKKIAALFEAPEFKNNAENSEGQENTNKENKVIDESNSNKNNNDDKNNGDKNNDIKNNNVKNNDVKNNDVKNNDVKNNDVKNNVVKNNDVKNNVDNNEKNNEINYFVNMLKEIVEVFNSDKMILAQFRSNQTPTRLSRKNNFKVVNSTSSTRKVVNFSEVSQSGLSFNPSVLPNVLFEDPENSEILNTTSSSMMPMLNSGNLLVPSLSLNSNSSIPDYVPLTRSTRRAFSAINSLRNNDAEQSDIDQELDLIGSTVGHTLVERFFPKFYKFLDNICLQEKDDVFLENDQNLAIKLNSMTQKEILSSMFDLYKRYRAYLFLLVFNEDEIKQIDRSFLKFITQRNQYVTFLVNELDNKVLLKELSAYIIIDEIAALWLIKDLVATTDAHILIPQLIQKTVPLFQRAQNNINLTTDRDQALLFIPWVSCYGAFLEMKTIPGLIQSLAGLCSENLSKLIPIFAKTQSTATCRAGLLAFFRFGCYLPHLFHSHISFQNKATSILHNFIRSSIKFSSCVKAATDFFIASWRFLDEEVITWHTGIFYHFIIAEIAQQSLRDDNLNAFIAVMTLIVANRQKYSMEQLGRLNFLMFMINHFQLEESVDANKQQSRLEEKKSIAIFPNSMMNQNVSYLDLPKFPISNDIPSLNLENPKLQLHFQPIADFNTKSYKMTITLNEYQKMRKKYPIYATHTLHCHFVQLLFATLIDHSLHRLDVFFCDPFPQVNRKPNVLFTLMKHMEMKANANIIHSLDDVFTPPSQNFDGDTNVPLIPILKSSGREKGNNSAESRRPPKAEAKKTAETHIIALESVTEENEDGTSGNNSIENNSIENNGIENNGDNKDIISIFGIDAPNIPTNLVIQPFKSVPNFIASSNDEDLIESSVRKSSREEVAKSTFKDEQRAQFQDYQRLLKMAVTELFHPEVYQNGTHIASGAFGAVMAVTLNDQLYAVKVLEKSRNEFDNPHLIEVYTEVSILENCKGDRRVTQLFDFGCTNDSYYIVMEYYPSTLKSWRKKFSTKKDKPPESMLLRLFREFLKAATVLTDHRINHFDIKCDNVMLDREGFPALADFGEAMSYKNEFNCITLLNKGTEWIKSPEMLSIALNSSATNPNYDRLKKVGAGPASDIWSIGCLFFELMTGEFLFVDSDWSRFFLRITDPKKKLLTEDSLKLLGNNKKYSTFLEFVLQRSERHRPNLQQVTVKFDEMFPDAMKGNLPKLVMPKFT